MFFRDPLDIAPHGLRPTVGATLLLVASVTFACAAGFVLRNAAASMGAARAQEARILTQKHQSDALRAAQQRAALDPASIELERVRSELRGHLDSTWSGIFDAIEIAGHKSNGQISLASVTPASNAGRQSARLAGNAASSDSLMRYIAALESLPQVSAVDLIGHQSAPVAGQPSSFQIIVFLRGAS